MLLLVSWPTGTFENVMPFDAIYLKAYAKRKLGYSSTGIEVELDDDQLQDSIDDALEIYGRFKPKRLRGIITVSMGVEAYDLGTLLIPPPRGVLELQWRHMGANVEAMEFTNLLLHMPQFPFGDFQHLASAKQWLKTLSRVIGTESDWEFDEASKKLFIANIPIDADKAMIYYIVDPALSDIPNSEQRYIKDLVLAESMLNLAFVRGKHKGIPTPVGNISMNAKELEERGSFLKATTVENIQRTSLEPVPMIG